ncbi:hypothetical protein HNR27_002504 [Ornithinibacillus bavariensis]
MYVNKKDMDKEISRRGYFDSREKLKGMRKRTYVLQK